MLQFDYIKALYRRDNNGNPCVWYAEPINKSGWYNIYYGIVGRTITSTTITSSRNPIDEIKSKINEKRKQGYKYLSELKDNNSLPVKEELFNYLNTYLPNNRTTGDGTLLPMLAKTFDNTNNKVFNKVKEYYGQYKINGLRCFITAHVDNDIFSEIHLKFQSREGTYWNGLKDLEEYLLDILPQQLLYNMIDNGWALDGEIYLPNHSINEINHFVKTTTCPEHKLLQFWCYDIAIRDMVQHARYEIIGNYLNNYTRKFITKNGHYSNTNKFIILPLIYIDSEEKAIACRDMYINMGFEGLIMRNPAAEYEFGSRKANVMIKYKKATDGKFLITDIIPEGIKRPDIPLFICKNDINDAKFECHVGGSLDYQKDIFKNKEKYIGKYMFVEYGERSGVEQVPFHVKTTMII